VVTDYLMPGMTGTQLAAELTSIRRDLPVVLLTGYVENLPAEEILAFGVTRVLSRRASLDELASVLREVLDAPASGDPGRR
jgi:CheY-like chemotaxis protein